MRWDVCYAFALPAVDGNASRRGEGGGPPSQNKKVNKHIRRRKRRNRTGGGKDVEEDLKSS